MRIVIRVLWLQAVETNAPVWPIVLKNVGHGFYGRKVRA